MNTDKELADDLDARERLRRHGYRQVDCPSCTIADRINGHHCFTCGGKGYTWKSWDLIRAELRARQRTESHEQGDWLAWRKL